MYVEFPVVAFVAAASLSLPLLWHWRARNVATLALVFWLFISNVIYGVDAILWGNNTDAIIPVWCDITTKAIIGANFALPAACLCICIHLERVASGRMSRTIFSDKRQRQIFEASMCFGLPILFMGLHFIVQGHRYDIIEGFGCRPTTYFSIPSIFIVWLPPLLMATLTLVFASLSLRHFVIRRLSFASHLSMSNSALTTSTYLRLMLMSILQMFWSIAVTSYTIWFTVLGMPLRPWTTWADVHSDFSRIDAYPAALTPPFVIRAYYVLWWMVPASTFAFVAFFAFGREAIDEYRKSFSWISVHIPRFRRRTADITKLSTSRFESNSCKIASPTTATPTIRSSISSIGKGTPKDWKTLSDLSLPTYSNDSVFYVCPSTDGSTVRDSHLSNST